MKVEKPEHLKQWMVSTLKPICDAEPTKLARYVLALVRKERSGSAGALRSCLTQQLHVFLQHNTALFVDILLKTLYSGEYMSQEDRLVTLPTTLSTRRIVQLPDALSGGGGDPVRWQQVGASIPAPGSASPGLNSVDRSRSPSLDPDGPDSASGADGDRCGGRLYSEGRVSDGPVSSDLRHRLLGSDGRNSDSPALSDLRQRLSGAALGRQRCPDFEERGICLLGGHCRFDHGPSAFVLQAAAPVHAPGSQSPTTDAAAAADSAVNGVEPYRPESPGLVPAAAAAAEKLSSSGRQLSSADGADTATAADTASAQSDGELPPDTKPPQAVRLHLRPEELEPVPDPAAEGTPPEPLSLTVSPLPDHLNQIMPLNEHFEQFGCVTNVQVSFGGDRSQALVTFANVEEAAAALAAPSHQLQGTPISVRAYPPELDQTEVVLAAGGRLTRTVTTGAVPRVADGDALSRRPEVAEIRRSQQLLAATVSLQNKSKQRQQAARALSVELRRRETELLSRQLSQQRALLCRLEAPGLRPAERAALLDTLKQLQESAQRTRCALTETLRRAVPPHQAQRRAVPPHQAQRRAVPPHQAQRPRPRTRPSTAATPTLTADQRLVRQQLRRRRQLELLDLELELHQRQLAGSDTQELQLRLQQLSSTAGQPPAMCRTGRSAGITGGGRRLTSIDRRPRTLLVSSSSPLATDHILTHLKSFGVVTSSCPAGDGTSRQLLVTFATRAQAEAARSGGAVLGSTRLSLEWPPASVPVTTAAATAAGGAVTNDASGCQGASAPPAATNSDTMDGVLPMEEPLSDGEGPLLEEPLSDSDGALLEGVGSDLDAGVVSNSGDEEGLLADSEDEAEAGREDGHRAWRR